MLPNRIHTSKSAQDIMSLIKQRTGITPNLIARLAIAKSIESGFDYKTINLDTDGQELNMSTLLGDLSLYYEHLLLESHGIDESNELAVALTGHLENGLGGFRNIKNLTDLLNRLS